MQKYKEGRKFDPQTGAKLERVVIQHENKYVGYGVYDLFDSCEEHDVDKFMNNFFEPVYQPFERQDLLIATECGQKLSDINPIINLSEKNAVDEIEKFKSKYIHYLKTMDEANIPYEIHYGAVTYSH